MTVDLAAEGLPPDPRIGAVLQDRYRILRKLGEGGMGAVYEGEHLLIGRRVAIKCLHAHYASNPEVVARFQREALAATAIGHPNIIECTDMGRFPDGAPFMVLEFLGGRDWATELEEGGPQSLGVVVHIASQVCDALDAAHAKGIVHRDLKPENIFLVRRGGDAHVVKVLDFGISKMQDVAGGIGAGAPGRGMTKTGMAMGTPHYMPPEQARGAKDIDHRADVYALGVILYQALSGQLPFAAESFPMLVLKVCTEAPSPLSAVRADLPEAVVSLVARMLEKDPAARPSSCGEVKAVLAPFASDLRAPPVQRHVAASAATFPGDAPLAVGTPPAGSGSAPVASSAEAFHSGPGGRSGPVAGTEPRRSRVGVIVAIVGAALLALAGLVGVVGSEVARRPAPSADVSVTLPELRVRVSADGVEVRAVEDAGAQPVSITRPKARDVAGAPSRGSGR